MDKGLDQTWQPLCPSSDLVNGGQAVIFDVRFAGQTMLGFAIRFEGQVAAYLNRCPHVAMEMDWRPGHFFDAPKELLMCSTHGALFEPLSGRCISGPCVGKQLIAIGCTERDSVVYWQTAHNLEPVQF